VAVSSDVVSSADGRIDCGHLPHRGVIHHEAVEASAIRPVTGTASLPFVVLKTEPVLDQFRPLGYPPRRINRGYLVHDTENLSNPSAIGHPLWS
jgi:hypothetical protein